MKAQIQVYSSSDYKASIVFRTDDLPPNTVDENGFVTLNYKYEDLPIIMDLIRNESPLFLWVNPENGIGGIASEEQEPVGEGE